MDLTEIYQKGAAFFESKEFGFLLDYVETGFIKENVVIIVDGGFRRGSDVLKGLAFGASLIGLGRPILHGLAAGGEAGVKDLICGITRELQRLMTMVGVADPSSVQRDILIKRD